MSAEEVAPVAEYCHFSGDILATLDLENARHQIMGEEFFKEGIDVDPRIRVRFMVIDLINCDRAYKIGIIPSKNGFDEVFSSS